MKCSSNNVMISIINSKPLSKRIKTNKNSGPDSENGFNFTHKMKKVFPSKKFVPLPNDHPLFNSYFNMPDGLPKIHEHDNKPAQALALFEKERMIVLYTYESDLGDGWEDSNVHKNPWPIREAALKMGVNIIYYALSQ